MATLQLSSSTPTEGSWTPPDLEKALGLADLAPFYSFTIQNESGISQSYSLLSQLPIVKPSVDGITSHTILVARGIATRSGSAYFTIPRDNFYAICGTSHSDTDVQIQVLDKRSVKLGSGTVKNLNPGTTCIVEIASETPAFALSGGHAEDKGGLGAFCIKTGQDFKYQQAKNNGFVVALGLSASVSPQVGLFASFVPMPQSEYQIKPSKVFYVVARELEVNQPKPFDIDFGRECKIDFDVDSPHVRLVHDDNNKLIIAR